MSLTQFAMVEELAFLIKDNLPCKHLILSVEETLLDFLQEETSLDGMLELEPMNPYNRLLVHRLADIFGFSHQSVGEGDARHLILRRCPETVIPSILISDLLWQYDGVQCPTASYVLSRREEASPVASKAERPTQVSLEEREAAYLAARDRIFSVDDGETKEPLKEKPRSNPVVARRMIAHALGQRIERTQHVTDSSVETCDKPKVHDSELVRPERKGLHRSGGKASTLVGISGGKNETTVNKVNLKEEHIGAAKRMFANALGFHSSRDGPKQNHEKKV